MFDIDTGVLQLTMLSSFEGNLMPGTILSWQECSGFTW